MNTYYIDSVRGCDCADGLAPDRAWKSLEKANEVIFTPGDRLMLASGSVWEGACLMPKGSGTEELPCVIEPWGAGPRPAIHAAGKHTAAVHFRNVEGWEVRGLEVTNTGAERANYRVGILAELTDLADAHHIVIENNFVHDVNGSNVKAEGDTKGGIHFWCRRGEHACRFIDAQIVNNHILRCDRVGIYFAGRGARTDRYASLDVIIYGNLLEDIGGDGILNIGTDGCIVERNRLLGARMRDNMYCAGIWPYSADHTVIRYNEAAYCKGTKDGQGFDSDDDCIGTIHEYNYSHDNDGGYMLVCTVGPDGMLPASPHNVGCLGTKIYRNLTVNDMCRTFHLAGPVVGTAIEENCVYIGEDLDIPVFQSTGIMEGMGPPEATIISRNIIASRGNARYVESVDRLEDGTFTQRDASNPPYLRFTGNAFLGNHTGKPQDDGRPIDAPTLEELEAVLLDENGKAKPGLDTLDAFLDLMGWPKE